ncbi:hypothetical protein CgunFtcFv8_016161 [Champsocephalus gunnari]|uniref:Uncharacterized protein n=1 Tax=Champsocephalus gunnari TaxID=52237 RepID=A0AAN8CPN2_CHAGU|nr:hypothetical protein CgunFtcFv8_016161 [Champsocephalus gunnari]
MAAGAGTGTVAAGAETVAAGAETVAAGAETVAAGARTEAGTMALGARAASLDLRLPLLGASWRLCGPPKARVPENGSWTGAGTGEEAEVDSRRNTPRRMVSGWKLGGRGLTCLERGLTSKLPKKSSTHSGSNSLNQGLEVTSWRAAEITDCLSSVLEAYLKSFLKHVNLYFTSYKLSAGSILGWVILSRMSEGSRTQMQITLEKPFISRINEKYRTEHSPVNSVTNKQ